MKPFKTHEEQLEILKSRNLIIDDNEKALSIIESVNYYNIVNGYKLPFLKKDEEGNLIYPETFIDNCNFNNLLYIYNLDMELKSILFRYLLEFERTLKSYISYIFSKECGRNEKFFYLNFKNYSSEAGDLDIVLSVIKDLSIEIKNKKANFITHYLENHEEIPLWVLINQLTLGNISYLYRALKNNIKEEIAKKFSLEYKRNYSTRHQIGKRVLIEVIKIVIKFRNICAHDNILLLAKIDKQTKIANIRNILDNPNYEGRSLYDLICALKLVIKSNDFIKLKSEIKLIFEKYKEKFDGIHFEDIIKYGGFESIQSLDEI